MFFKGSRYGNVPEHEIIDTNGRRIRYKKVRYIGPARPLRGHIISEGELLYHVAYTYYRDPERFWRVCDANIAMWPDDLAAQVGLKINIPAAEE